MIWEGQQMFGLKERGGKKSYKGKVMISRLSSRSAGWRFEIRKLCKNWAFKSLVSVLYPWKLSWKRLERLLSNAKASWLDGEFLKEFAWLPPARTPEKTSSYAGGSWAGGGRAVCTGHKVCAWPVPEPNLYVSSIPTSHPSMKSMLQ